MGSVPCHVGSSPHCRHKPLSAAWNTKWLNTDYASLKRFWSTWKLCVRRCNCAPHVGVCMRFWIRERERLLSSFFCHYLCRAALRHRLYPLWCWQPSRSYGLWAQIYSGGGGVQNFSFDLLLLFLSILFRLAGFFAAH